MRHLRTAFLLVFPAALVFGSGPDDRRPTDPKSITSPSNPSVKSVAIEDLYAIPHVDRGSWSPDGKWVAFESDITGRNNIWKMRADGRDPAQLVHSEDRQIAPVCPPMENGSSTSRTSAAEKSGTYSQFPSVAENL